MTNFDKHPEFIVQQENPFNGGPPPHLITKSLVTPAELFFVRNHASVPDIDPSAFRLKIEGLVETPLELTLDQITAFSKASVQTTLQCAGNRRTDLIALEEISDEVPWNDEAISHAVWSGTRLSDVLQKAGVKPTAAHVEFIGMDQIEKDGNVFGLGGSIPVKKALSEEVLLAYEMNGLPLPPTHGYPLRAIVPGYIGARSVKWLSNIQLGAHPSDNYFQAKAYKIFPSHIQAHNVDWAQGFMLGEHSVNSAICSPQSHDRIQAGSVVIEGYATAGGDRTVERVEVSIDVGKTWLESSLSENSVWSWRFWSVETQLRSGTHQIISRAWDSATNSQPEDPRQTWNFKGYMNNAWSRINITVE